MRIIIKYNLLEASNNYTVNQKANPLDRRPVPATRDEVKTVTILERQGVIEIQETPALPRKAVFPSKVNRLNSLRRRLFPRAENENLIVVNQNSSKSDPSLTLSVANIHSNDAELVGDSSDYEDQVSETSEDCISTIEISSDEDECMTCAVNAIDIKGYSDDIKSCTYDLTEKDIDFAQKVLKRAFPEIQGLRSILDYLTFHSKKSYRNDDTFIQIILLKGNHWVTCTNIFGRIEIFDSRLIKYETKDLLIISKLLIDVMLILP